VERVGQTFTDALHTFKNISFYNYQRRKQHLSFSGP